MERAERNVRIYMNLYPPNAFFISPSYAKFVGNLIIQTGKKFPIKTLLGWNEPGFYLPSVREKINLLWKETSIEEEVKVCDVYGMVEMGLLGFECQYQKGLHGFEDSYIYEIINPLTGKSLGPGEEGELVVSHLEREAMPLIRYRTGDITTIDDSPCSCGRTHLRLLGIKGRWAERLEVNGIDIYPSQVEEVMAQLKEYSGDYNILINGSRKLKALEIALDQRIVALPSLSMIRDAIERELGVPVNLRSIPASELFVYPHRSQKIIDQANLDAHRKELEIQKKVET
jgi:phenylacetate-CoA ligase